MQFKLPHFFGAKHGYGVDGDRVAQEDHWWWSIQQAELKALREWKAEGSIIPERMKGIDESTDESEDEPNQNAPNQNDVSNHVTADYEASNRVTVNTADTTEKE